MQNNFLIPMNDFQLFCIIHLRFKKEKNVPLISGDILKIYQVTNILISLNWFVDINIFLQIYSSMGFDMQHSYDTKKLSKCQLYR